MGVGGDVDFSAWRSLTRKTEGAYTAFDALRKKFIQVSEMAESNQRSRETSAPPDRVWRVWSDTPSWPEWNPDMKSVDLDGPFASGTTGKMETKSGGHHQIALQDVEEGRGFTLVSDGVPLTKLHFRCEIAASGAGSRISQAVTLHGGLAMVMGGMVTGRIVPTFDAILEGLAAKAEAAS
jgi:hypothetical protein